MSNIQVGLNIFSILSEALYDDPRMLFREYFQNSIDSVSRKESRRRNKDMVIKARLYDSDYNIIEADELTEEQEYSLVFIDNGAGVKEGEFKNLVGTVALSKKLKSDDIGYMGIGRLSGYSYCDRIEYINIKENEVKDAMYLDVKKAREYVTEDAGFSDIGAVTGREYDENIVNGLTDYGFIVILRNISNQLKYIIKSDTFINDMNSTIRCRVKYGNIANEDVKEFFDKHNSEVNYKIYIGNTEVVRDYNIDEGDSDFLITSKVRNSIVAKTIKKVNKRIQVTARKKIDNGIRVYYKGMLLDKDLGVVDQIRLYFGLNTSSAEMMQAFRAFYYEMHITADINLRADRKWFSYSGQKDDKENLHIEIMQLLLDWYKEAIDLRYKYSRLISKHRKYEYTTGPEKRIAEEKLTKDTVAFNNRIAEFTQDNKVILLEAIDLGDGKSKSDKVEKHISKNISKAIKLYLKSERYSDDYTFGQHYSVFIRMLCEENDPSDED